VALRPDGVLVTPFTGAEISEGTFDAECVACAHPPDPECGCGIHYFPRALDVHRYTERRH